MNRKITFASIALLFMSMSGRSAAPAAETPLLPFHTDGCSGMLTPNGTWETRNAFLACCKQHDVRYWQGGTEEQKLAADIELRNCIAATRHEKIAAIYYNTVRAGGSPLISTPWRWGYGWVKNNGYAELTPEQKALVDRFFPDQDPVDYPVVDNNTSWNDSKYSELVADIEARIREQVKDLSAMVIVYQIDAKPTGSHWMVQTTACPKGFFRVETHLRFPIIIPVGQCAR